MRRFLAIALVILAAAAFTATLISLLPTDFWFIRIVDLVREPFAYAAVLLGIVALVVNGKGRWLVVALFGMSALIHTWRIWPYSNFAAEEIDRMATADAEVAECFTALSVNVKVKNTGYAQVAAQIEEVSPDLLLLMETDENWVDELQGVLADYPLDFEFIGLHPKPPLPG